MTDKDKKNLKYKVLRYAKNEFSHQKTVDMWHDSMLKTLHDYKENKNKNWKKVEF